MCGKCLTDCHLPNPGHDDWTANCVVQTGLELKILLLLPPKCEDSRRVWLPNDCLMKQMIIDAY